MKISFLKSFVPSASNVGLALISTVLLILAFPDFDFGVLAGFALVPLFIAVNREKESFRKSFVTGWIFGTIFFFVTCWWLTFAPITYAGFPFLLAYFLLFCVASVAGLFPALFGGFVSILLRRFGIYAIFSAPFLWIFTEFLRYWLTGNNWNAIGYSQAFNSVPLNLAEFGGVYLVGYIPVLFNCFAFLLSLLAFQPLNPGLKERKFINIGNISLLLFFLPLIFWTYFPNIYKPDPLLKNEALVVAVQPNVPMNGMTYEKYEQLLQRHIQLAEDALKQRTKNNDLPTTVVFPESPMIFTYGRDQELQMFLRQFALRNNVSVLFNSAELTENGERAFNSAVMIDEKGEKIAQYDKIHLLPFGEFIPFPEPLASTMPAFVGNFEHGREYDLLPFGQAKGGVMICFESHFGELSREYTRRGADVLVEMTNDGYLGPTPVLQQHLANSVFRAVETNRPVLRVTNVGVTAYINEHGAVYEAADVYSEATRVWTVSKSDGSQTFYVKFGDWFAWLCSIVSLVLVVFGFLKMQSRKVGEPQ